VSNLFFQLGRTMGYATIPAIRKTKLAWKSLTGTGAESIEAETEFGRALAAELKLKTGVSRDAQDVGLVDEITRQLATCVRNKARTFKTGILLDPSISAVSLPGGYLFISQGLLPFCDRNPDELAFVIGHEMGHVVRGHALDRVLLRIGSEGLSSILSRGLLTPMLRDAGLKWLHASYAAEPELEADEFAVRVAGAAGYRAEAALQFLGRTTALRASGGELGEYLTSHPPDEERCKQIRTLLKA
jgi:predicted Zn-dependent protease